MSAPISVISNVKNCIGIKTLLTIDKDYLKKTLKRGGYIRYDDNVTEYYNRNEILFIRDILEPIVKLNLIQELNLVSDISIKKYYSNNRYTGKTINSVVGKLSEIIVMDYIRPRRGDDIIPENYTVDRSIIDYYLDKPKLDKTKIPSKEVLVLFYKYCYEMIEYVWNEVVFENLEYTTGIDIRDFLDIQFEPELMDAIADASEKNSVEAVNYSYDVLDKIMKSDKFKDNPIAIGYNALTMNPAQLRQMLACRGFVTEINGQLFKRPVTNSFVLGMKDIYEFSIESRSGAKALYFTIVGVEKSEYMARGIQLVATALEKVIEGNCGTKEYVNWYIRKPEENSGSDDLQNMLGIYYLDEDSNTLRVIDKTCTHLYGKSVKIRHISKCSLKNPRHVCHTCLGNSAYSLFRHNNVGFFGTTITTSKSTQFIISTKHLTMSAKAVSTNLNAEVSKYLLTRGNSYYVRANVSLGKDTHKIIVEQSGMIGLKELNNLDIENNNPIRNSRLNSIYLDINTRNTKNIVEVKLRHNSSFGVFTRDFLKYMQNRWTLDSLDRVVIDLEDWDKSKPIVYTPEIEYSYLDLAIKVKSMFDVMDPDETPEGFLQKLFDVINSKLSVNLSLLSAMSYGFTVRDIENGDFRLSRNRDTQRIIKLNDVINGRSLGVGYGWEDLGKSLFNPGVYYGNNNVSTPLDIIIDVNNGKYMNE